MMPKQPITTISRGPGIEVTIGGAVRRPGRYMFASGVTVGAALLAAGGLAQTRRMWASGGMTIQRPRTEGAAEIWPYDLATQAAAEWGRFVLQGGDVVTLQWHIKE